MKNLCVMFSLFWSLGAAGQTEEKTKQRLFNITRVGLYGTAGMHFSNYTGINKTLSDSGYSTFYKEKFALGFGFTARSPRGIFNADYLLFSQCNVTPAYDCSHIDFASYSVSYGFDMTKKKNMDVYPFLGISRNRTDILLSYVLFPEMPWDQFLLTHSNVARLTRINYSLHLGAGFDYFLPVSKKHSSEFLLGLYAGYYLQLNESTWYIHVDELPVTNVPYTNPGGAYLKARIGICF